jgi:hypothetical protein
VPTAVPAGKPEQDPITVIALIYRVVDEPRRVLALLLIMLPVLAAATQLLVPTATLFGIPTPALWWSATGSLGGGWLLRAGLRRLHRQSDRVDAAAVGDHSPHRAQSDAKHVQND